MRGEGQQPGDRAVLVYLGLALGVGGEVFLEAASLLLGQGAEDVGVFEVFEDLVVHLAHLGTAASLDSKKSLIFFSPRLMQANQETANLAVLEANSTRYIEQVLPRVC